MASYIVLGGLPGVNLAAALKACRDYREKLANRYGDAVAEHIMNGTMVIDPDGNAVGADEGYDDYYDY